LSVPLQSTPKSVAFDLDKIMERIKDGVYTIRTKTDLGMVVQKIKTQITDSAGTHDEPEEIGFLVEGYSSQMDENIEDLIIISKQEARNLIAALEILTAE